MPDPPRKSLPPDPAAAAQLGQELISKLQTDFATHKPTKVATDLLAQIEQDFGAKKRAEEQARAHEFAQALLGKVARDFGSVRPGPTPDAPPVVIPAAPAAPRPVTLAPPPTEEDLRAAQQLEAAAAAPLGKDDEEEVAAMSGGGAFGFFKKLLGG
ncbi:MAG: hypothetical protein U0234_25445 [Sandaracinus sp.]